MIGGICRHPCAFGLPGACAGMVCGARGAVLDSDGGYRGAGVSMCTVRRSDDGAWTSSFAVLSPTVRPVVTVDRTDRYVCDVAFLAVVEWIANRFTAVAVV